MERSNGGTTIALIQTTRAENDHKKDAQLCPEELSVHSGTTTVAPEADGPPGQRAQTGERRA